MRRTKELQDGRGGRGDRSSRSTPSIAARREEILRLIAKVYRGGSSSPASAPSEDWAANRRAKQQQDLAALRKRRQQLEEDLQPPDEPKPEALASLEARVTALERLLPVAAQEPPKQALPQGPADAVLTGNIREGLLADILQLVASNMMSGVFLVEHKTTRIQLFYREGEVFHAEGEGLSGENAFFAAVAMEAGQFSFTETAELPDKQTINSQTQFLILEALRQIDEARARHE